MSPYQISENYISNANIYYTGKRKPSGYEGFNLVKSRYFDETNSLFLGLYNIGSNYHISIYMQLSHFLILLLHFKGNWSNKAKMIERGSKNPMLVFL